MDVGRNWFGIVMWFMGIEMASSISNILKLCVKYFGELLKHVVCVATMFSCFLDLWWILKVRNWLIIFESSCLDKYGTSILCGNCYDLFDCILYFGAETHVKGK